MEEVETTGKEQEFALTPVSDTAIAKRSKPTLVELGNRLVPSDGRWHAELAADYIISHGGLERWIPTGEMARVFFGSNTPKNKQLVRRRLFQVFRDLLDRGLLLVVEYHHTDGAQACKLYDARSEQERQQLNERLKKMERLKLMKAEQFERAIQLTLQADAEIQPVTQ